MSSVRFFGMAGALVVMSLAAAQTQAQTARSGGGANAQLLQQLQQLAAERTSMEAELTRTKKELEDTRKQRDELKSAQQAMEQRARSTAAALAQSSSQRASSEQELSDARAKMQELVAKFRETLQTLREVESQSTTARGVLATRDQELKTCVERNQALYKLDDEVLTHWEHESAWSGAARAEPFTKIKRVQLENLVDDYKARADDQRVNPASAPAQPAGPATPAAAPASAPSPGPAPEAGPGR
jgi:chromosome segregation ATPase